MNMCVVSTDSRDILDIYYREIKNSLPECCLQAFEEHIFRMILKEFMLKKVRLAIFG